MRQVDLGIRLGVPPNVAQQTVSRWERNLVVPETNTLPVLATMLECRITDFFAVQPGPEAPPAAVGAA